MRRLSTVLALVLAGGALATGAAGEVYYGCFICDPVGLTGIAAECQGVGDNETGDGTRCRQDNTLPWPAGPSCSLSGNPCYTTVVDGGGDGGGPTTGGGGSCRYESGYCAPWCAACNQYGG